MSKTRTTIVSPDQRMRVTVTLCRVRVAVRSLGFAPMVVTTVGGGLGASTGGPATPQAPLAVTTSRSLAFTDAGRILQCANGITLTVPPGLPGSFAAQVLVNASQVLAGGAVTIAPGSGVSINGAPGTSWLVERVVGSTAPWMAWLQHETGTDAYSLIAIGASISVAEAPEARAVVLGNRAVALGNKALVLG
jgi:hypothetical protein